MSCVHAETWLRGLKHITVNSLWVQEAVREYSIEVEKIRRDEMHAHSLASPSSAEELRKNLTELNAFRISDPEQSGRDWCREVHASVAVCTKVQPRCRMQDWLSQPMNSPHLRARSSVPRNGKRNLFPSSRTPPFHPSSEDGQPEGNNRYPGFRKIVRELSLRRPEY